MKIENSCDLIDYLRSGHLLSPAKTRPYLSQIVEEIAFPMSDESLVSLCEIETGEYVIRVYDNNLWIGHRLLDGKFDLLEMIKTLQQSTLLEVVYLEQDEYFFYES